MDQEVELMFPTDEVLAPQRDDMAGLNADTVHIEGAKNRGEVCRRATYLLTSSNVAMLIPPMNSDVQASEIAAANA